MTTTHIYSLGERVKISPDLTTSQLVRQSAARVHAVLRPEAPDATTTTTIATTQFSVLQRLVRRIKLGEGRRVVALVGGRRVTPPVELAQTVDQKLDLAVESACLGFFF